MRFLSAVVCLAVVSFPAFAQSDRGTITGTVSDPAGAVVPGASIEARNVATDAVYPTVSSSTGNFTIPQLPAGNYELVVTITGFKKFVRTGLVVEVAGNVRVDARLEIGAAAESVTVTEAAPLLKTEGGEVSQNVTSSTLDDLPILTLTGAAPIGSANTLGNIRNPLASVNLLPGARMTTDSVMRINGMPSNSQTINIEGQDATNGFFKQQNQINQAGQDAIQEVTIQTSNFAAEYGQAGGGYFNYTMKSGTNQWHGSAYDYFVNEAFNAGLPFTDAGTTNPNKIGQHIRNPIRQNDYGFTLGGPVRIPKLYNGRDKTFFFFNFEQFRQSAFTSNTLGVVPTQAFRNGDFSAALQPNVPCNKDSAGATVCVNQIFDPASQAVDGTRQPFSNNQIPFSRIDPTALIIQNMIPLPNNPGAGITNYLAPGYSNYRHTTIPSFKIDHNLSDKLKLAGYYSSIKTYSPQTNGFPQPYTALQPQNAHSQTIRLNLDYTVTPTLLLHFGAGLVYTTNPQDAPQYDQARNKLFPQGLPFAAPYFPYVAGLVNALAGGWNGGGGYPAVTNTGVAFTLTPKAYDTKPTFNTNAIWVKGNHTYKVGATAVVEGIQSINASRADGQFGFSAIQTADTFQNGLPFANFASTGFPYASFFLGYASSVTLAIPAHPRLGNHSVALYLQDSWKVTRKFTFDYGLRWDYATLWKEQYGRMQNAAFTVPNPEIGGRLGTVIYEATCKCTFAHAYPFAIGPHLGAAYQIDSKTVFRAGGAVAYSSTSDQAGLNSSAGDFYGIGSPSYGAAAGLLKDGNPYAPGNRFGNTPLTWPDFNPLFPFPASQNPLVIPPSSPFVSIAPNAGRLPRIFQWSIGFQRELTKDIAVEISYVGNRGVWWASPLLAPMNYNALTPQGLLANRAYGATQGIDVTNSAPASAGCNPNCPAAFLNLPISNPSVVARYPLLANPANVYPGFPAGATLGQALRPYPQWNGIPPFLGPPNGKNWYDALQIRGTKRFSHGLSALVSYAWQKELTDGTNSNTSYVTPSAPLINDVYNFKLDKQISGFSQPQVLTIAFNYLTPRFNADNRAMKALSWVARDWTIGGVLSYRSGQILQSPPSANNLLANLQRGPTNNPAIWGGGYTFMNRVPGQSLFLVNPNSKIDPTSQLVLNPAAWVEPAYGTFGSSAAYFNDFRWQRQPGESLAFGRVFAAGRDGKYKISIRAEFQNIFNRTFYSIPADGAGTFTTTVTGRLYSLSGNRNLLSSGFGFVNWLNGGTYNSLGAGPAPRSGQVVAKFQF